ncbi:MAG: ABC transporter ATP-binding protein [Candidatus Omnitrophica bacterium]|nr:ABC transporter ATP-binding protein [Candidatus Omnitrophota bacterium]
MIEIRKLCKSFENVKVLDNISLNIKTGETMVIIGRSGVGKSVLLKHIIGILAPDSGEVIVDGKNISRLKRDELNEVRLEMGMLFQGAALFDSMTVGENVGFLLREHTDLDEEEIEKRIKESLAIIGLRGIESLMPVSLSGGMKKRVGLARAICSKSVKIVLYDEPTTGIDPIMGDTINNLIISLHDKLKITSVAVTHDMNSAYKIADRIAMLYKGKIIAAGTPDEIRNMADPFVRQFITGAAHGPITEGKASKEFIMKEG